MTNKQKLDSIAGVLSDVQERLTRRAQRVVEHDKQLANLLLAGGETGSTTFARGRKQRERLIREWRAYFRKKRRE